MKQNVFHLSPIFPRSIHLLIVSLLVLFIAGCSDEPLEKRSAMQAIDTNGEKPIMNGLGARATPPDFSITTLDGKIISLESFNEKPVLLYFFTTWCPYCKEDLTALSSLYADYEQDIHFVAIDMDLGEDPKKISEYRLKFPDLTGVLFATGNSETLSSYQIKYTTTKYAIGKDGKILYAGSGALTKSQWKTLLDALKNSEKAHETDALQKTP
ncbi:MAG TPA: TlpA disulfide reductase family protein [Candidatus Nanoarchaeia archaeon]|nr:TlpA disulfide reductase family protein [Candidatus Nanoarchaeia archaeon]